MPVIAYARGRTDPDLIWAHDWIATLGTAAGAVWNVSVALLNAMRLDFVSCLK